MPGTRSAQAICKPGAGNRRVGEQGYVLIELMLALLIVSLLAGLALPWRSSAGGAGELKALASRVAVLLRADRNAALRSGEAVVSDIDPHEGSVRSGSGTTRIVLPPRYAIRASDTLARGVRFDPDGHAQGGEIALLNGRDQHVILRIDPLSAAIEVQDGEARHGP